MKTLIFLTLVLLLQALCCWTGIAQSSHADKLPWVTGKLPAKHTNFDYMVARGEGKTLKEAREDSFNSFLIDLGNNAGVSVNSQTINEIKSNLNYSGNTMDYNESTSTATTYNIQREGFNASFSKVSEYYEQSNGRYLVWELYEVATGKSFKPYIPEYTDRYGISAGLRSVIVPGWGQFHKGKTGKGVLFLATEIAGVSSAVVFQKKRTDNIRLSQETTNLTIVKEYRDRADKWALYRNVAIGASAGIYVWNVLDAALAKGKIHYAWIPDNLHLYGSESMGYYYCGLAFNF